MSTMPTGAHVYGRSGEGVSPPPLSLGVLAAEGAGCQGTEAMAGCDSTEARTGCVRHDRSGPGALSTICPPGCHVYGRLRPVHMCTEGKEGAYL